MRALLALAASVAAASLPAPALAQETTAGAFVGVPAVNVHRGGGNFGDVRRGDRDRFRHDRRRDFGSDGTVFVYDHDYQGDTAWRSDSFNDWWHDRPDRNMPRWVQNNQNCQRVWWSGGGWRC